MTYLYQPRMTEPRRRWLQSLKDNGPLKWHGRGNTRKACMDVGWTEWYVILADGREMLLSEYRSLYLNSQVRPEIKEWRDSITDAGLKALNAAKDEGIKENG